MAYAPKTDHPYTRAEQISDAIDGVKRDAEKLEHSPGFLERVAKEWPNIYGVATIQPHPAAGKTLGLADNLLKPPIGQRAAGYPVNLGLSLQKNWKDACEDSKRMLRAGTLPGWQTIGQTIEPQTDLCEADEDRIGSKVAADVEADQASRSQWSETLARAQAMMVAEIGNGLFSYEPLGVLSVADPGRLKDLFGGGDPGRAESVRPLVASRRMLIPSHTHETDKAGSLVVGDPLYNDVSTEAARRKFWNDMKSWIEDKRGAFGDGAPVETSRTDTLQVYHDAALEIMKREGIENPEQYLVGDQRPPDAVRALVDAGLIGSYPGGLKTGVGDSVALIAASHPEGAAVAEDVDINPESLMTQERKTCAPPDGAEVGSLHWVEVSNVSTALGVLCGRRYVWEWMGDGRWRHDGVGDFAVCAYSVGYRYLGPAEYPPTKPNPIQDAEGSRAATFRRTRRAAADAGLYGTATDPVTPRSPRPECVTDWVPTELYGSVVAERDEAKSALTTVLKNRDQMNDAWVREADETVRLRAEIAAKDAHIAALETELCYIRQEPINWLLGHPGALLRIGPNSCCAVDFMTNADGKISSVGGSSGPLDNGIPHNGWRDKAVRLETELEGALFALQSDSSTIAAQRTYITELKTELALRPAAFVDPAPEPVKPNPFREHKTDPRRMGR